MGRRLEWAHRRNGELAVKHGRAKNSACPAYCLTFGFPAPVLSRDPWRATSGKQSRTASSIRTHLGKATRAARLKTSASTPAHKTTFVARRVFRPTDRQLRFALPSKSASGAGPNGFPFRLPGPVRLRSDFQYAPRPGRSGRSWSRSCIPRPRPQASRS